MDHWKKSYYHTIITISDTLWELKKFDDSEVFFEKLEIIHDYASPITAFTLKKIEINEIDVNELKIKFINWIKEDLP